jgi:hypothetical protein
MTNLNVQLFMQLSDLIDVIVCPVWDRVSTFGGLFGGPF